MFQRAVDRPGLLPLDGPVHVMVAVAELEVPGLGRVDAQPVAADLLPFGAGKNL